MHRWLQLNGDRGLVRVSATGAGGLLVKTSIFEKLSQPWWTFGQIKKDEWCDDIDFCNRCSDAGIEMHCDLDTPMGHIVGSVLWPNFEDGKWNTILAIDNFSCKLPIDGY